MDGQMDNQQTKIWRIQVAGFCERVEFDADPNNNPDLADFI